MRAALSLFVTALVVVKASICAAQGGAGGPSPIVITPADKVRIQTTYDPSRVPLPLRGQFVASMVGMNPHTVTFVLNNGQPAVVHRDLIVGIQTSVDHGSRSKHALIGAGIGLMAGAILGFAGGSDDPDFMEFSRAEGAAIGAILFTPICALIGTALPAGQEWKEVPLDRVELNSHD